MSIYRCSNCDEMKDGDYIPMDDKGRCEKCQLDYCYGCDKELTSPIKEHNFNMYHAKCCPKQENE